MSPLASGRLLLHVQSLNQIHSVSQGASHRHRVTPVGVVRPGARMTHCLATGLGRWAADKGGVSAAEGSLMDIALPTKDSERAREEIRLKLEAVGQGAQAIDSFSTA